MIAVDTNRKRIAVHRALDHKGGKAVARALRSLFVLSDVLFQEPWGSPGPYPFTTIGGDDIGQGYELEVHIIPAEGWTLESRWALHY